MTHDSPTIRVLDFLSSAGDGNVNEDLIGWTDRSCWVLDGATPVTPSRLGTSDALWLVEQVDDLLRSHEIGRAVSTDVAAGIAEITLGVQARLEEQDFPQTELPPACSLGLVVAHKDGAQLGIVGDISLYVPRHGLLLDDDRFGHNESRSKKRHLEATLASELVREDIAGRRRKYIDGPGEMYVLSRNPRAALGVRQRTVVSEGEPLEVLAMSDGFARLVESYGVFDSYEAMTVYVRKNGLGSAHKLLRDFESNHANEHSFKRADDASAAILLVN